MGLKNEHKSKRPVWRKANGEIDCPGDNCKQKCDERCPIWCHTKEIEEISRENWASAINWGKKTVNIAPDYAEAWNNMGVAYGNINNHQKAYECFKKALEIQPNYSKALNGLKIAEENLSSNSSNEDFYDFLYTKEDAQDVIRTAYSCAKEAYQKGLFPRPSLPNVPELMGYLDTVPIVIWHYLVNSRPGEFGDLRSFKVFDLIKWSFFSGIGAVQLWHYSWNILKGRDLMEMLTEKITFLEDLDKFVCQITYGSNSQDEFKEINSKIKPIYFIILPKFGVEENEKGLNYQEFSKLQLVKMSQIAYLLGCAYRLHELGMH